MSQAADGDLRPYTPQAENETLKEIADTRRERRDMMSHSVPHHSSPAVKSLPRPGARLGMKLPTGILAFLIAAVMSGAIIGLNPGQAVVGLVANALAIVGVATSWAFACGQREPAQASLIVP